MCFTGEPRCAAGSHRGSIDAGGRRTGPRSNDALQHFGCRGVLAEPIRFAGAVVITRPRNNQVVLLRQFKQPDLAIVGIVTVVDLESEKACVNKLGDRGFLDHAVTPVGCRMRQHGHSASGNNHFHTVERAWRVILLVVAALPMQDALKRCASVGDMAARDKRVGDVWTTDGPAVDGLRQHVRPGDVVVGGDAVNNTLSPMQPAVADPCRLAHNRRVCGVEQVREHVHARWAEIGAQLHPGQNLHATKGCCAKRFVPPCGRVVVGEGDGAEPGGGGRMDELCRRFRPVGHTAMGVQVDCASARGCEHPAIVLV